MEYSGIKLFEIESLYCDELNFNINLNITLHSDTSAYSLKVDNNIYQQISKYINSDGKSRYRLSLQCKWNPFLNQFYSKITRIKGETNHSYYFNCSEEYRNLIWKMQSVDSIQQLNTIQELKPIRDKNTDSNPESSALRSKKKQIPKDYKYLKKIATVSLFSLFIFIGSAFSANSFDIFTRIPPSEEKPANNEIELTEKAAAPSVNHNKPEDNYIPSLEITKDVTFSLPEGYVALTFDDGPSCFTKDITDILTKHEVGATFFLIGNNASKKLEIVKYLVENGMSVANHSWSHSNLSNSTPAKQLKEIVDTNNLLTSITKTPVTLFRPPYGSQDDQITELAVGENMKVLFWNRDPKDWRATSAQEIIQYFKDTNPSSGVYILHENKYTLKALPAIIEYLQKLDLEIVTLH